MAFNMSANRRAGTNMLDTIRKKRGNAPCVEYFKSLQDSESLRLVNDPGLTFASFFVLMPVIQEKLRAQSLSARDLTAANLCNTILSSKKANGNLYRPAYNENTHEALRWMFLTGADADGLSEDFDHILDISAGILTKKYHDADILPKLVELVFSRGRRDAYLHDLAWAFFQSHDPTALKLAAEYLRSGNEKDAKLARSLLHLNLESDNPRSRRELYNNYLHWLSENNPYLYFTSENFNETNQPNVCSVDLSAKYLYRKISPRDHKPSTPLTETERNCLACFLNAPDEEKEFLARFSQKVRAKNPEYWNRWIRYPLEKQIEAAHNGGEGEV